MNNPIDFFADLALSFLPFLLFAFLNCLVNVKKEVRNRQYAMPLVAFVYCAVLMIFLEKATDYCMASYLATAEQISAEYPGLSEWMYNTYENAYTYLPLVLFNTAAMISYVLLKCALTRILGKIRVRRDGFIGAVVELFYAYDARNDRWYIKDHCGQARTFIKTVYYSVCIISVGSLMISCAMSGNHKISVPFSPVFALILIGEMAFFVDGLALDEFKSSITMQTDRSRHVAMYPLLRNPLRLLFGDKLAADGTTVNNTAAKGGAVEDVLVNLEETGGHLGKNYAAFIRKKMEGGLKPNVDYVRTGYALATGKSLLFNTPFYDKLSPYVFYAMNRNLLTGGKTLIVLGRHGTEEDLSQWCEQGMRQVSNIPNLWKIRVLDGTKCNEDNLPDIGIISRSGVHDLDIHKNNLPFLKKVSFVVVVEPSRLVTTAQIGLNLLIKCCGKESRITFCSVDRNCDGLVDALSHILMTDITEVSATEYPHGISSYMYWTADDEHLQHRILPGVSRYLGMGTELSVVALKNQVPKTMWYGGDAFPVQDARWIAKQYYHDLLEYAKLPANQETFDKSFQTSFNMCNEKVSDYSYITVEDDRNNLFEMRRNFATIAEEQGFVNVISSEYMLREYMASNTQLFTADAKAIPYITADYARTKRNAILSLCMLMCIDSVQEEVLRRQLIMLNLDTKNPVSEVWNEICTIFGDSAVTAFDKKGNQILTAKTSRGKQIAFERDDTIFFRRMYSVESGKFESVYTIENQDFVHMILDDLQHAVYIAEEESKDAYIGTELKGHVYQKYLPGQFFTLNGKYYEMVSTTRDNRILVRRASDHINGRLAYRQVRQYKIHHIEDSPAMGALKTVNDIDIHYQFADFSVETPGYWKLGAYNDFDRGDLVMVNGVPVRQYHHKQILKFDFSRMGDGFTDSVRMTLTNLLNEVFVTLFADNQPFISAITPGSFDAPITYSLALDEGVESSEKCIYIIEDSQLDIGLLVAVERNVNRIFQIIADYLTWNEEQIEKSHIRMNSPAQTSTPTPFDVYAGSELEKRVTIFVKLMALLEKVLKKEKAEKNPEDGKAAAPVQQETEAASSETEENQQTDGEVTEEATAPEEEGAAEQTPSTEEQTPADDTVPEDGVQEEPAKEQNEGEVSEDE